jgi:hypothetical protein
MTHYTPDISPEDIPAIAFTPCPPARSRHDGWSAAQQQRFIVALALMGSVRHAAKAVGMGRASAYRLRERAGAQDFARAWDIALEQGRARMFDYAMDRAINGVTTVRVLRGGSISLTSGPDMNLIRATLRDVGPVGSAVSGGAVSKAT